MIALALALVLQGGGSADPLPVRMGVSIQPETVFVGDPFLVRLRVQAPAGATIAFPAGPDSLGAIEALDPMRVEAIAVSGSSDRTAVYRLVAWDIGEQPLRLGDVTVRLGDRTRVVSAGTTPIVVGSVLPADSALRVPKPPRELFVAAPPWWRRWLPLLAALLVALLIGWLWWRRRRRGPNAAVTVDPFALAEREFARVESLGLVEAGERGRFVALMVEVMRDFLAARVAGAHPSLTSSELVRALGREPRVPLDRLAVVLHESDLIKFARRPVSVERARELARDARAIVREIDAARTAAPAERAA